MRRVSGAWLSFAVAVAVASWSGCAADPAEPVDPRDGVDEPLSDVLSGDADLVAIPRSTTAEQVAARARRGLRSSGSGDFYLAIRRSALQERWFWSTYLEQLQPYGPSPGTLGTRVVRFREHNGKLFVLDADDRRATSDVFEPELIIDSFEIVHGGWLSALPGSGNYVVIDPAAGQNRFGALADWWAEGAAPVRLETELSFVEDFKSWSDGASYAHVFAAYADRPIGTPADVDINEFRVGATTRVTLRRYAETPGYTRTPAPGAPHYFLSDPLNFGNPSVQQYAVKWAIRPGMQPIKWKIGRAILDVQSDPSLGGADLLGAIKRGVESWNDAFGFPVFTAELAGPNDRFGDDHHNFIIVDPDPSLGYAYADWRINPNTHEVRGASVYLSGAFFYPFPDDDLSGSALAAPPAPRAQRPRLTWQDQHQEPLCIRYADERRAPTGPSQLTGAQKLEHYIQEVIAHEIGHTLGLRHNFKGSLVPPTSSVMEYNLADVAFVQPEPGPYDVDAIRYLYGLSSALPAQPFCTDEHTQLDPNCVRFDVPSPTPLVDYQIPQYQFLLGWFLEGWLPPELTDLYFSYYGLELMGYARAGDPWEAQAAWNEILDGVRAPIDPWLLAALPSYGPAADAITAFWFREIAEPRAELSLPITDPVVIARVAQDGRGAIVNLDGVRSYATRRQVVDALKSMQHVDAYVALLEARATLSAQLGALATTDQALTRDLIARIDAATSPYFE
jgi:hypothetical protein